jgi:hypothetical protein
MSGKRADQSPCHPLLLSGKLVDQSPCHPLLLHTGAARCCLDDDAV